MIYMAKITTFEGQHWFYMGKCDSEEKAWEKAQKYACEQLKGAETQVKKVITKIKWLKNTEIKYKGGRMSVVESDELLQL